MSANPLWIKINAESRRYAVSKKRYLVINPSYLTEDFFNRNNQKLCYYTKTCNFGWTVGFSLTRLRQVINGAAEHIIALQEYFRSICTFIIPKHPSDLWPAFYLAFWKWGEGEEVKTPKRLLATLGYTPLPRHPAIFPYNTTSFIFLPGY